MSAKYDQRLMIAEARLEKARLNKEHLAAVFNRVRDLRDSSQSTLVNEAFVQDAELEMRLAIEDWHIAQAKLALAEIGARP